jgi:hypothetical protein
LYIHRDRHRDRGSGKRKDERRDDTLYSGPAVLAVCCDLPNGDNEKLNVDALSLVKCESE